MGEPMLDFYAICGDMRLRPVASVEDLRKDLSVYNWTLSHPNDNGQRTLLSGPYEVGNITRLTLSIN